jgi:hypothetical protein
LRALYEETVRSDSDHSTDIRNNEAVGYRGLD